MNIRTIGWIGIVAGLLGHILYKLFPFPSLIGLGLGLWTIKSGEKVLGGLSIWFSVVAAGEAIFLKLTLK